MCCHAASTNCTFIEDLRRDLPTTQEWHRQDMWKAPTVSAWRERATELARWSSQHLVNRADSWGTVLSHRNGEIEIRPVKKKLSERILCRHFGATRCSDLVALDSLSAEHTARWMAIELARRDEDDPAPPGVLQRMASYPSQHHRHNQMSMCPNPSRKL